MCVHTANELLQEVTANWLRWPSPNGLSSIQMVPNKPNKGMNVPGRNNSDLGVKAPSVGQWGHSLHVHVPLASLSDKMVWMWIPTQGSRTAEQPVKKTGLMSHKVIILRLHNNLNLLSVFCSQVFSKSLKWHHNSPICLAPMYSPYKSSEDQKNLFTCLHLPGCFRGCCSVSSVLFLERTHRGKERLPEELSLKLR